LFSWENVPGSDSKRLLKFLWDDLGIDWAKNADIEKTSDSKTIRIFRGEWEQRYWYAISAEIELDEKKEKVALKISDTSAAFRHMNNVGLRDDEYFGTQSLYLRCSPVSLPPGFTTACYQTGCKVQF
jgi:hypothetical protein